MSDPMPTPSRVTASTFFYSLFFISVAYCLFEYFFIPREVLTADEFVFARHIYEYTFHLPYRDFAPYKTVLGYYLLSLPLFFSHSLLAPLFYIKDEIALLNAIFIVCLSYSAKQLFDKKIVLFALLLILANQHFLIYASDLRVDMLTSWLCLFAALSVLQKRLYLGGFLLGIAFLISQKALWYGFAIDGALLITWLAFSSSIYSLRSFIAFNIAAALPVLIYIACWSVIASPTTVLYSLFYEAYIQANIQWYAPIYLFCWITILSQGPLLFLTLPLTLLNLNKLTDHTALQRHIFIISFAFIALFQFINYKQPFPYNFVFTIPAFFLLYADFLSALFIRASTTQTTPQTTSSRFKILIASYAMIVLMIVNGLALPIIYNLIVLIPIIFGLFLFAQSSHRSLYFKTIIALIMITGIIYPLYRSLIASHHLNGHYQQTMLINAMKVIQHEGDYLGGIPYFYNKDQPIDGMKNLIGPELDYLYQSNEKIEPLLLPSLYLAPTTTEKVLDDLEKSSIKIIINNYRIMSLPPKIKQYIMQNYDHYDGSLLIYAPLISSNQLSFYLKFTNQYRIDTKAKSIKIDGKKRHAGQLITLKQGDHTTEADRAYRLTPIQKITQSTHDSVDETNAWISMTRAITT